MAGFWNDFSSSFTSTLGAISKFPSRTEREATKAQTEHLRGQEEREQKLFPTTQAGAEADVEKTKADTGLTLQQTEDAKWKNSEEYRNAITNGLNSEATRALSEAGFNDARAKEILHGLTDAQVKIANAKTEAETKLALGNAEAFIATAAKTDVERKILKTELDPKFVRARRQKIEAEALELRGKAAVSAAAAEATAAGTPAIVADTDTKIREQYEIQKAMAESYGTPFTETLPEFTARVRKSPDLLKALIPPAEEAVPTTPPAEAGTPGPSSSLNPARGIPTQDMASAEGVPEPETAEVPGTVPVSSDSEQAIPTMGEARPGEPTATGSVAEPPSMPTSTPSGGGNVIEAQAGTRRLPLNQRTRTMLEAASADTGLTVKVTSGAQPNEGPNRKGSHRHDKSIGAADIKLLDESGRVLNMSNADDAQRMGEFAAAAKRHGATGFGAHPNYMGNTTMHVGFGTPAVWGAGGTGRGADFLENALSGVKQGTATAGAIPTQGETADLPGVVPVSSADTTESTPESRAKYIADGKKAAREGLKYLYEMIGPQSAVPTQERQQQLKALLTGQGGPDSKQLADMRKSVQASMPTGQKRSLEEMNIVNLNLAYKIAMIKRDPKAAQIAAAGLLQAYRQKFNQFTTFAQMYAQQGKLDESGKLAAKAYAYIPDGKELIPSMDKDGNMVFKIKDLVTGNIEKTQILTPQQWFSTIMGVSSYDFDKQLMRMAGENPEYAEYAAQASAVPEIQYKDHVPQHVGPAPLPNTAALAQGQEQESTQAMSLQKANQAQRDALNKQIEPPAVFDEGRRTEIENQIGRMTTGQPGSNFQTSKEYQPETENLRAALRTTTGGADNLNALITDTLRVNPNAGIDTVVPALSSIVSARQLGRDGKAYIITDGDYEETAKIQAPGSPVQINIPYNYAYTITKAADEASAKKMQELGSRVKTDVSNAYTNAMNAKRRDNAAQKIIRENTNIPDAGIPMLYDPSGSAEPVVRP